MLTANNANPDLKWETTDSYNIGLDLNMFSNRIEFIADWYYKKTRDLLLQIPLPAYLGSSGNGAAKQSMVQCGQSAQHRCGNDLEYSEHRQGRFPGRTNLVFSLNRNKVISLDTESSLSTKLSRWAPMFPPSPTTVGHPIGQFWGYKVIGRFDKASDFYYKDADGNVKAVALPEAAASPRTRHG